MIRVEVSKNGNENTGSLLRRFSRKSQSAGLVRKVRQDRYRSRPLSEYAKKQKALKRIARRKEYEKKLKLGLVSERRGRPGRTRS